MGSWSASLPKRGVSEKLGETRGDARARTTVHGWLGELVIKNVPRRWGDRLRRGNHWPRSSSGQGGAIPRKALSARGREENWDEKRGGEAVGQKNKSTKLSWESRPEN